MLKLVLIYSRLGKLIHLILLVASYSNIVLLDTRYKLLLTYVTSYKFKLIINQFKFLKKMLDLKIHMLCKITMSKYIMSENEI